MAGRPPLTARQRQVLDAIRAHFVEVGYAPSVRELCVAVGLSSTFTVQKHLDALERKGYLRRPIHYGNRAIALVDEPAPAAPGPRLGRVLAVLRIDVPAEPAPVCTTHPRTADNRWFVAGVELCRACGRAAVAEHLARERVG